MRDSTVKNHPIMWGPNAVEVGWNLSISSINLFENSNLSRFNCNIYVF